MKREPVKYNFDTINPTDYKLELSMKVKNTLMMRVFTKAREKLARTKNINVKGNPQVITKFEVEPQYYNVLKVAFKKKIREVIQIVKEDGIEIMNYNVVKPTYWIRDENKDWKVVTTFTGIYADKR